MIRVFLVDDHKMVIEGMQLLLQDHAEIEVTGFALSGEKALDKIEKLRPNVVLMDINLPGINGIETTKKIKELLPQTEIIAISMHKESSLIKLMLSSGAKGYVLKNAGQEELVEAIKAVHNGKTYLDDTVNQIVINSISNTDFQKNQSTFPKLSRREKEVLRLIINENTTREIAEKLCISFGTVETHRRNMLIKTGARNTVGLVKLALDYDLLN